MVGSAWFRTAALASIAWVVSSCLTDRVRRGDDAEERDDDGERGDGGGARNEPAAPPNPSPLRAAAEAANRRVGAAVDVRAMASDGWYGEILGREFDSVTPENAAKWGSLAPSSGNYNWAGFDGIVDFAEEHDQGIQGHTLLWHRQAPSWVNSLSGEELSSAIQSHIEATLDRYRGRVHAWDVVNEAIDTEAASGYRESVFYERLGPEYIADSFRWARDADPDVVLYYNDYGIERLNAKSDFAYAMIRDLLDQGVPIDGIGFQSHISTHRYPSESDLRANIRRFADLGLTVHLSEIDARTKVIPGDEEARWYAQRIAFQQIVGSCVVEPGCNRVTFWGLLDQYSWINDEDEEDALLFDRDYSPKPAHEGALDGFAGRLPQKGDNWIENADFSSGTDRWTAPGGELTVESAFDGDGRAACATERTSGTDGLLQSDLPEALYAGGPAAFSAMVRIDVPATVAAALVIHRDGEPSDFNIAARPIEADEWFDLSGYLGLGFTTPPSSIGLKLYGPPPGVSLCIADVKLQPLTVD